MRTLRPLVLAAFLAAPAAAQTVTFTGVIEKDTLPSICLEGSHYLTCSGPTPDAPSGVRIKSSTLDLTPYEGQIATFEALARGVSCLIYDVTAVQAPAATLTVCGTFGAGCPIRFRVGPPALGQFLLFASEKPAFVPLDPTLGTLLLAPPFLFLGGGTTPPGDVDLTLPIDSSVIGVGIWAQGARWDIGPVGPAHTTNAVCFEIGPPPFFCETPGC